eukprot:1160936-Pelagomonas_calceolata.AAC.18
MKNEGGCKLRGDGCTAVANYSQGWGPMPAMIKGAVYRKEWGMDAKCGGVEDIPLNANELHRESDAVIWREMGREMLCSRFFCTQRPARSGSAPAGAILCIIKCARHIAWDAFHNIGRWESCIAECNGRDQ